MTSSCTPLASCTGLAVVLVVNAGLSLFYHLSTAAIRTFLPAPRGLLGRVLAHLRYQTRGIFLGDPDPAYLRYLGDAMRSKSPWICYKGLQAVQAFVAIYNAATPFVTRGDDSGTHKKELSLWKAAGVDPKGAAWYTYSVRWENEHWKVWGHQMHRIQ